MNLVIGILDDAPHPVFSGDASWAGVLIILIFGLIIAATAVGVVVRMNRSDD